jgi:lipopolysaccharide biosynthesis glycosyltransferase
VNDDAPQIVLAGDHGYLVPVAAVAASLGACHRQAGMPPPDLHLVWDGADPELDELARWYTETFGGGASTYDGRPLLSSTLTYKSTLSAAAYLRLQLDHLLPPEVHRFAYIDGDVTVCRDVCELVTTDLGGFPVGAVRDSSILFVGAPGGVQRWREERLDPSAVYVNSGILVVDRAAWRGQRIGERAIDYALAYGDSLLLADQDALNVVLHGEYQPLDPRWNVQVRALMQRGFAHAVLGQDHVEGLMADPYIVHFAGQPKPWNCDPNRDPWTSRWWTAARSGPFPPRRGPSVAQSRLGRSFASRLRLAARAFATGRKPT